MNKFLLKLLLLIGCVLHGSEPTPGSESSRTSGIGTAEIRYPLQAFDSVTVAIYQQADLSSSQRISDIGTISLPLVGEVKIAGMTTSEAQRAIASAYIDQEYLVSPIVTVYIDSFTAQTVTVLGEVSRSGQIILPDGVQEMPIQEIIAKAGDFSGIARSTDVRIERRRPGQDEPDIFIVDVKKIIESTKNNEAVETFMVRPGDYIFVPRRAF